MNHQHQHLATRCAHGGASRKLGGRTNAPFQEPIAQSTLFNLGSTEDAEAIFSGARKGYAYTRFGNPSVDLLAATLADLEGGAGAMITSSGNAAVLCAVTAALDGRSGPLLTHPDIYGGSSELLQLLARIHRLPLSVVDPVDATAWKQAVMNAGAVLMETPSNPLMRIIDIRETAESAHASGAAVIVDNTVATPFNQRPFEFGADWVVHSMSKFLNGHSDMIGGCVISRKPLTSTQRSIHKNLGGTINALDAWLVQRGLRTFALRMAAHNQNGLAIAEWLNQRPEVARVNYPGLASYPQAELFGRQMKHGGALMSFELKGGKAAALRFLDRLQVVVHAVSFGGLESLATRPAATSHRGMTETARQQAGVSDALIRLSVGTEAIEDLYADLEQALSPA